MDKIWYVIIGEKEEGPYSIRELIGDSRVTLDTLAWKQGFESWLPIRDIDELRTLFEEESPHDEEEGVGPELGEVAPEGELVIDIQKEPPFILLWLVVVLIVICYVLYQLYG